MPVKNTPWKLYLDDIRHPADTTYIVARTVEEAKQLIEQYGVPEHISFDHDLGVDDRGDLIPDGYDFAKWLVAMDMEGVIKLPKNFTFEVHSKNPVGAENIRAYLSSYLSQKAVD